MNGMKESTLPETIASEEDSHFNGEKQPARLKRLRDLRIADKNTGIRAGVKAKVGVALAAFGAALALFSADAGSGGNDGHGSCSGCGVCSPPPIASKRKREDGEDDKENGNKEDEE